MAVDEAQEYRERWLEAKKANSEAKKAVADASKEVKKAQDAQVVAEEKMAEAEQVKLELAEVQAAFELADAEVKALHKKLQKAEGQIAAAKKISEGLAELG